MKAALVMPGGPTWPDPIKASRYGINRFYYDPRPDVVGPIDAAFLAEVRKRPAQVGIQQDPTWYGGLTAEAFAEKASFDLTRLGVDNLQCGVMLDMELHDPAWVSAALTRWRQLRPTRDTIWTLEPFQGGWISPELAAQINADRYLKVCVQYYLGEPRMFPADPGECIKDLEDAGISRTRLIGFYDAERTLPSRWNGVVYNFDALP